MGGAKVQGYTIKPTILGGNRPWLVVFDNFHSVKISSMTNVKLTFNNQVSKILHIFSILLFSPSIPPEEGHCSVYENRPSQVNLSFLCPYIKSKLDGCSRNPDEPIWKWVTWLLFPFKDRLRKLVIGSAVNPLVGVSCVHMVQANSLILTLWKIPSQIRGMACGHSKYCLRNVYNPWITVLIGANICNRADNKSWEYRGCLN